MEELEEKYKNRPKITFYSLSEEGNLKYMQCKRDYVWTILGWSFVGNFAGLFVVNMVGGKDKWANIKYLQKREVFKVAAFLATVGAFTYYGFAKARQQLIK